MVRVGLGRRSFVEALVAVPFGGVALSAQTSSPPVGKVAAGSGRANDIITLPGGDRLHVKVATQDSGGALFMTEQPIERRGSGPPKLEGGAAYLTVRSWPYRREVAVVRDLVVQRRGGVRSRHVSRLESWPCQKGT